MSRKAHQGAPWTPATVAPFSSAPSPAWLPAPFRRTHNQHHHRDCGDQKSHPGQGTILL